MKKTIIALMLIFAALLTCACTSAKPSQSVEATAPATQTGEVQESGEAQSTADTNQKQSEVNSDVKSNDVYNLYQKELKSIISEMDENITDDGARRLFKSYSRGALVDCDGTESKQFMLLFSPDGNNLHVELMRADKDGKLLTVRDDLGLLAGSLGATVKTGLYGEVPALFVVTTNYDASTRFGTVYVYSLADYDIQYVYEQDYTGDAEYAALESGILATTRNNLCKFGENGSGQKIEEISLK